MLLGMWGMSMYGKFPYIVDRYGSVSAYVPPPAALTTPYTMIVIASTI